MITIQKNNNRYCIEMEDILGNIKLIPIGGKIL